MPQPLRSLLQKWRDVSIGLKLYLVVGAMALLVAAELATLMFAMNTLSSVRAFVGGEGLWSKAQKDAVYSLRLYATTGDETYYYQFKEFLRVPLGDRKARLELMKPEPDLGAVFQGFVEGRVHPHDIPGIIKFIRRFHKSSYVTEALRVWSEADILLEELQSQAKLLHDRRLAGKASLPETREAIRSLDRLNVQLTVLADHFSYTLGEGSRWLEGLITVLLVLAVLSVEGVGLGLTFAVSRRISRGLQDLKMVADRVAQGDFSPRIPIASKDEIGQVSASLNAMTVELERNTWALKVRDEFLSIASHELKTPITALLLQLEMAQRVHRLSIEGKAETAQVERALSVASRQADRLADLVEDLLDVTRIKAGKLAFNFEDTDLSALVEEVVQQLADPLSRAGCVIEAAVVPGVCVRGDRLRMEQVIFNLLSNVIKYAPGKPVRIGLSSEREEAILTVQDFGPGIAEAELPRIFERFHRVASKGAVPGLGLGLFLVEQIVAAHGGRIEVRSKLGEGTVFSVYLPSRSAH